MKQTAMVLALTGALGMTSVAQATLLPRLGGQAVYDTDRNITWLANANLAATNTFGVEAVTSAYGRAGIYNENGSMSFETAQNWIQAMNTAYYLGVNNWRLPTTQQPDYTCSVQDWLSTGPQWWQGVIMISLGWNCMGGEMGNMFYTNLGGTAGTAISAHHNSNYRLFSNIQDYFYWSGTEVSPGGYIWDFAFGYGFTEAGGQLDGGNQLYAGRDAAFYTWAVRNGDIATVPEPAIVLLFGAGAMGLGLGRRYGRRRHWTEWLVLSNYAETIE